jgi:hypothetical protein
MKTLQQIYDFCLLDRTYRAYFDIPDPFECKTRREYRYYHAPMCSRGVSRAGTFIYWQAMSQLNRYLQNYKRGDNCFRFHLDVRTYEIADHTQYEYFSDTMYITTRITGKGARICFTHPFNRMKDIVYHSRSHNEYTEEGVRRDVISYINKKLLYPPGRYRDLQLEYKIPKEEFISWYKNYKACQKRMDEDEYWEMIEKYNPPTERMDFEESYGILVASGIFYDMNISDEYEKEVLAEEFMDLCNR